MKHLVSGASVLAALWSLPAEAETVFVDVETAAGMIDRGAIILDARGGGASPPFIPEARVIEWKELRGGIGRSGKLASPQSVKRALEALGVSTHRPVLVYGAMSKGWGEEGRIWWTLRYLGHTHVRILDGGIDAWKAAGKRIVSKPGDAKASGSVDIAVDEALRVQWRDVKNVVGSGAAQIIDSRTEKEYGGATPYWSYRGGHVPKARHFYWKDTLGKDGKLLGKAELEKRFREAGIDLDKPIITYCTGGVRSAFLQGVLLQLGAKVSNYDGSWWEWASRTNLPIEKPKRR